MAGVALALDGVVDDSHGLTSAHVDGADGLEQYGCVFFEHGGGSLQEFGSLG